jgi:hypothetical protein
MVDSVNAAGEDASGVNASRMDMSSVDARRRRRQTRRRVNAYPGREMRLIPSDAALLKELIRSNEATYRSFQLQAEQVKEDTERTELLMYPDRLLSVTTFVGQGLTDKLHGDTPVILVVSGVAATVLLHIAIRLYLRWKRRPCQATDLESGGGGGGGGGGWLGLFMSLLGWRN